MAYWWQRAARRSARASPAEPGSAIRLPLPVHDAPEPATPSARPVEKNRRSGRRRAGAARSSAPLPRRPYARWRALSLSLVYVLFAIHIAHWKIAGRTLAPLELNEVMYTLELGIITAGFISMTLLVLGTLLFGRFFCSWACHIMVLQDLCGWILARLGIRRKPLRFRLLLWIPPLTAGYMFVWPQIVRMAHDRALPTFRLATDQDGWGSLITADFWRNLPGPGIIVLTFLVCGFLIVWLLGTRSFCTYVCPYGAVFGLADRFSPLRIRVDHDRCVQCATCTRACTTGIRVHDETREHDVVVNPACMKDLDCVAACPEGALSLRFGRPALWRSHRAGGRFGHVPYDFTLGEELLAASVFAVTLLSLRGLYGLIPFLLSLALGVIFGYLAVIAWRLARSPHVELAFMRLKRAGRLTPAGGVAALLLPLLAGLIGHCGFVRFHEYVGLRRVTALHGVSDRQAVERLASQARRHLLAADRWGLVRNPRVQQALLAACLQLGRYDEAEAWGLRYLALRPRDDAARLQLADCYLRQGRTSQAERTLGEVLERSSSGPASALSIAAAARRALAGVSLQRQDYAGALAHLHEALRLEPSAAAHAALGSVLAELGRLEEAAAELRAALRLDPGLSEAHYNLGVLHATSGRLAEAVACYERALASGGEDADVLNNLGFALLHMGRPTEARNALERAIRLRPSHAAAHLNLGQACGALGDARGAAEHLELAVRLDPRLREVARDEALQRPSDNGR